MEKIERALNFLKQWELACKQAGKEAIFYANFQLKYPNVKIVTIHDSWLFEKPEDYQLFKDELDEFLKRQSEPGGDRDASE
jgi:hypothetical protein